MRRRNWRDSKVLNWRFGPRLCIRLIPGLWLPDIYWNRKLRHFSILLPFLGIAFDYKDTRDLTS